MQMRHSVAKSRVCLTRPLTCLSVFLYLDGNLLKKIQSEDHFWLCCLIPIQGRYFPMFISLVLFVLNSLNALAKVTSLTTGLTNQNSDVAESRASAARG